MDTVTLFSFIMVNMFSWSSSSDSSSDSSDSDSFTRWSLEYQASRNRKMLLMGQMMMLAYLIELEREEEEDDDEEEEEEEESAHSLEMREVRSRKRNHSSFPNYYDKNKKKKENPTEISTSNEPFPTHLRPTPEECRLVRDSLLSLHGYPKQFAKYSKVPSDLGMSSNTCSVTNQKEPEVVEEAKKESVLDGLVNTLLSQNTTEANSTRAFASLKAALPTWEDVLAAELKCIEDAIRCGGLAVTKASCIKNLLASLFEKKGKLCLEYLRDMSVDEIKAELSGFKGIGPKTVACVLMFNLQRDDFPVDTHVFRLTKAIGWVPDSSDRKKAYLHLNKRIPNELKLDLNCLLITHGKLCQRCKKSNDQQSQPYVPHSCPLSNYYCSTVPPPVTLKK